MKQRWAEVRLHNNKSVERRRASCMDMAKGRKVKDWNQKERARRKRDQQAVRIHAATSSWRPSPQPW